MPQASTLNERLFNAAFQGEGEKIFRLLAQGADPNARDNIGRTPLHIALLQNQPDGVVALIPASDPLACDKGRNSALATVFEREDFHMAWLRAMVSAHPGLPARADARGATPLMLATAAGRADAVEFLLPLSDPRPLNGDGGSCMMVAIAHRSPECLALLLDHELISKTNRDGRTALMHAAAVGDARCCALLLPHSDLAARDRSGRSAIELAQRNNHSEAIGVLTAALEAQILREECAASPSRTSAPRI